MWPTTKLEPTGYPVRPLRLDELRPALQQRYVADLDQLPERVRADQLTRWGTTAPDKAQTQKELMRRWKLTQGAVSTALTYLMGRGYVVALPKAGQQATLYVLSGVSRLVFMR